MTMKLEERVVGVYQRRADRHSFDYSARMLYNVFTYQYLNFEKKKIKNIGRYDGHKYVVSRMDELYKALKVFYGPGGGGRNMLPMNRYKDDFW